MAISIVAGPEAVSVQRHRVGDTLRLQITVTDATGAVADLTGCTHTVLLKANRADADADAIATLAVDETDAATGIVIAELAAGDCAALTAGVAYHIGHRIEINGRVGTLWEGTDVLLDPVVIGTP